nr:hypothetical protein [Flavobacterium psychrophilum]
MKAIHNYISFVTSIVSVGNYKLKYNFESNSQRMMQICGMIQSW